MRVRSGAAATALVLALATGAPTAALGADQTPTPSAEELREAYPLDPSQDAGSQPAPPAGSGAETPTPTATPTPRRQEPRPATEPGDRAAAVGEDDGASPWLMVSLLALLAAAGAATLLVRRRASDGPRPQPAAAAAGPEPKAPLFALFERPDRTAAAATGPGAERRAPAPTSRRANGMSPAPAAGTAAAAGSSRTLSLVPAGQPGSRPFAAAASGSGSDSGPPPGPSASAAPAESAASVPRAPEAGSPSGSPQAAAPGSSLAPAPESGSGPAPESGSGLPPAPAPGPPQAPAAASASGDPQDTTADLPASAEDAAPAGTPGPHPPDPESTWTAAVEWRAAGGTSRFTIIATADDGGGATELASSEPVRWPPAGPEDVAALNAVVADLDATMLDAGWSALAPGDAWYAKRFAWDPQQAARPRPAAPSATRFTGVDAPAPAPAAPQRPGPPRQSLTAQPGSGGVAAARATPAGEPAADAASGRFVRRKPWPEDSESLWRCEIKWDAGYKTSRFTATMRRPGARRGRVVAASAPFKWMLMAEPSDDAAAYRPAVSALVRGLEAAGWERVEPGAEWWAERFVWRRDDPPPEQVETDPVTAPSSDTPR